MICLFLQTATVAVGTLEKVNDIQGNICIGIARQDGFYEHTWGELEERTCRLKETVHCGEQAGGDQPL